MGSLFVSLVQCIKYVVQTIKKNSCENGIARCFMCCIECCLNQLIFVMEWFNSWAYTYIGIHGTSYMTSAKNVMTLFDKVGWDAIVHDELVSVVLFLQKITIALLTGFVGYWYVTTQEDVFKNTPFLDEEDEVVGFVVGAGIGYLVSAILMELVHSAVHGVILCLAESPALFQFHHPLLAADIMEAWKDCYPDECADELTSYEEHAVVTC